MYVLTVSYIQPAKVCVELGDGENDAKGHQNSINADSGSCERGRIDEVASDTSRRSAGGHFAQINRHILVEHLGIANRNGKIGQNETG